MASRTKGRRAPKQAADKPVKKAFPLIGRNDLSRLLEQVAIFQNRAATANGSMGELVRDYVKKKHLHAGAFRVINRWKKMGERDPQALWLELAHIDDMREKAGLDRIAKSRVTYSLPSLTSKASPPRRGWVAKRTYYHTHSPVKSRSTLGMRRRQAHIFDKESRGHYVEPAWCSRRLFAVEEFKTSYAIIHDPACGWGTILKEASAAGYIVNGGDIVDRRRHKLGAQFFKRDFLTWHGRIRGSVVCNPPFDHVQEFCEHALDLGAHKVAMICLVRRLNAARWLQALPLKRVWLLTPRPSMPPGSWIAAGNKPGGGTQDFCWLVFEPTPVSFEPTIGWLHRDVAEIQQEAAE